LQEDSLSGGGVDVEVLRKEVEMVENPFRQPRREFLFRAYFQLEQALRPRYWEEKQEDWTKGGRE
jgi:hypothetical protein